MPAKSRTLPKVQCPRCHSERTRVRYVRPERQHAIVRHRLCLNSSCKARFRTRQEAQPEQFAGMDKPAA